MLSCGVAQYDGNYSSVSRFLEPATPTVVRRRTEPPTYTPVSTPTTPSHPRAVASIAPAAPATPIPSITTALAAVPVFRGGSGIASHARRRDPFNLSAMGSSCTLLFYDVILSLYTHLADQCLERLRRTPQTQRVSAYFAPATTPQVVLIPS